MKIALYIASLQGGGAERVVLTAAAEFLRRGHAVTLILDRATGPLMGAVPPGVSVVSLDASRTILAAGKLASALRKARPDVLISSLPHNNVTAVLGRALSGVRCGLLLWEHSDLSTGLRGKRTTQFILPMMRWLYPRADRVIAVSSGVARSLRRTLNAANVEVIYNGVPRPETFGPTPHSWLSDPAITCVIGVGRLSAEKDFATLVRAFAELPAPLRLILLGDGEERARLGALAVDLDVADRVHFAGFVDRPQDWIRRAQLLVLSSIYEGFGNVLVEAMACGVPVVSTDCESGPREILEDGKYGELAPISNPVALAGVMARVLANPMPPDQLKARAAAFSPEAAGDAFEVLFQSLPRGLEKN